MWYLILGGWFLRVACTHSHLYWGYIAFMGIWIVGHPVLYFTSSKKVGTCTPSASTFNTNCEKLKATECMLTHVPFFLRLPPICHSSFRDGMTVSSPGIFPLFFEGISAPDSLPRVTRNFPSIDLGRLKCRRRYGIPGEKKVLHCPRKCKLLYWLQICVCFWWRRIRSNTCRRKLAWHSMHMVSATGEWWIWIYDKVRYTQKKWCKTS